MSDRDRESGVRGQEERAEWPAEPWIIGLDNEEELIFQWGEVTPLLLVDPSRQMSLDERHDIVDRVTVCVNALAGIDDPFGLIVACKRLADRLTDGTIDTGDVRILRAYLESDSDV